MPSGIRANSVFSPGRAARTFGEKLLEVVEDLLDRLGRHPAPVDLDAALGGDDARLLTAVDRADVDGREAEDRIGPPLEPGDELVLDERDEMGRRADGVDALFAHAAVDGLADEPGLEPLEPLVADGDAVLGRLADDGAVGLEAARDQRLGAEALQLLVDDRGQRDPAGVEAARLADVDEGGGHGRQRALHVHGPPPEDPAVLDCGGEEIGGGPGVGRDRVRVAAKEKMPPGLFSLEFRDQVRPSFADLDELARDVVASEVILKGKGRALFLSGDGGMARRPDHGLQELERLAVVHVLLPKSRLRRHYSEFRGHVQSMTRNAFPL